MIEARIKTVRKKKTLNPRIILRTGQNFKLINSSVNLGFDFRNYFHYSVSCKSLAWEQHLISPGVCKIWIGRASKAFLGSLMKFGIEYIQWLNRFIIQTDLFFAKMCSCCTSEHFPLLRGFSTRLDWIFLSHCCLGIQIWCPLWAKIPIDSECCYKTL